MTCFLSSASRQLLLAGHGAPPRWFLLPYERDESTNISRQNLVSAFTFFSCKPPMGGESPGMCGAEEVEGDLPSPQLPSCWKPAPQQLLEGHFSAG